MFDGMRDGMFDGVFDGTLDGMYDVTEATRDAHLDVLLQEECVRRSTDPFFSEISEHADGER